MSVGLFILVTAASAAFLASLACLVCPREPWGLEETPERYRALERNYQSALRTIKDLEFDYQVGTLSEAEHAALRAEYKGKAVVLRRALEAVRGAAVRKIAKGGSEALSQRERERLEALVLRARTRREEPRKA